MKKSILIGDGSRREVKEDTPSTVKKKETFKGFGKKQRKPKGKGQGVGGFEGNTFVKGSKTTAKGNGMEGLVTPQANLANSLSLSIYIYIYVYMCVYVYMYNTK